MLRHARVAALRPKQAVTKPATATHSAAMPLSDSITQAITVIIIEMSANRLRLRPRVSAVLAVCCSGVVLAVSCCISDSAIVGAAVSELVFFVLSSVTFDVFKLSAACVYHITQIYTKMCAKSTMLYNYDNFCEKKFNRFLQKISFFNVLRASCRRCRH